MQSFCQWQIFSVCQHNRDVGLQVHAFDWTDTARGPSGVLGCSSFVCQSVNQTDVITD